MIRTRALVARANELLIDGEKVFVIIGAYHIKKHSDEYAKMFGNEAVTPIFLTHPAQLDKHEQQGYALFEDKATALRYFDAAQRDNLYTHFKVEEFSK